jgi:hypothetical protein
MALYFPVNWSMEPHAVLAAAAVVYIPALLWLAARPRHNSPHRWFPLGFIAASAIPALPLLAVGADLANARVLYLPSIGFCLLVASAADSLTGPGRRIIPAAILAFHFAALQHNLDAWQLASDLARGRCGATAGAPPRFRGVPFFANGARECGNSSDSLNAP